MIRSPFDPVVLAAENDLNDDEQRGNPKNPRV